jgi:predicted ATPase/DNA-binding winged helix-turn-helix (wHTH) protein
MSQPRSAYHSSGFSLDYEELSLVFAGETVRLTRTAFRIMGLLMQNAGRVVTKDAILEEVWQGRVVEEANISQHIFALRNLLARHGLSRELIANEPGLGYRFVGELDRTTGLAGKAAVQGATGRRLKTSEVDVGRRRLLQANLPIPPTPLIGRDAEVSELRELLQGDFRLITMTGGPGSGKSTLAAWTASLVAEDFPDGVAFVPLAAVFDPELVPSCVSQALGLGETGNRPIAEILTDYFSGRRMLLVLDNFEQVLPARRYLAEWLARADQLTMWVTSRAVLNLRGEMDYPVMPLPVPDLRKARRERFDSYPSVQLFIHRARLARPSFSLTSKNGRAVAEICSRLGGLPGAIELAAAKIKILETRALLARLASSCLDVLKDGPRDLAQHQQRMRSTVEWSYNLLGESDQVLLRRLSVFEGGFTLEAAEAICSLVNGLEVDVLEGVASLRNNSLAWPAAKKKDTEVQRFTMHEIVRQYGLERLGKDEKESIRRAHASRFRQEAERAEPRLIGDTLIETIEALDMDAGNVRAAVRWSIDHDPESAISIVAALRRYWQVRAQHRQARTWLDTLLNRCDDRNILIRARGLAAAGELACGDGDHESARPLIVAGLELLRDLGETSRARALNIFLGTSLLTSRDFAEAQALFLQTLEEARKAGDERCVASSLMHLGVCSYFLGDMDGSIRWHREALRPSEG